MERGSRPDERRDGEVAALLRRLDDCYEIIDTQGATIERQRQGIESARRELERASDVRANRTKIIGNAHMILAALSEGDSTEARCTRPSDKWCLDHACPVHGSEGDSTERCGFTVGGKRCEQTKGHDGFHGPDLLLSEGDSTE